MWFTALGDNIKKEDWLINLLAKLFSNSPSALTLFRGNPFPEKPPNWIRIMSYKYNFTNQKDCNETRLTKTEIDNLIIYFIYWSFGR